METVPWYQSNTFRGLLLTLMAFLGDRLLGEGQGQAIASKWVDAVLVVAQVAGLAWAAWGRTQAHGRMVTLTRRTDSPQEPSEDQTP